MQVDELLKFDSDKSIKKLDKLGKTEELLMEEKIRVISYRLKHGYLLLLGRILGNYYGSDADNLDFSDDNAGYTIKIEVRITSKIFRQVSIIRHAYDSIVLVGLVFFLCHRKDHSRTCRSKFLWINAG